MEHIENLGYRADTYGVNEIKEMLTHSVDIVNRLADLLIRSNECIDKLKKDCEDVKERWKVEKSNRILYDDLVLKLLAHRKLNIRYMENLNKIYDIEKNGCVGGCTLLCAYYKKSHEIREDIKDIETQIYGEKVKRI